MDNLLMKIESLKEDVTKLVDEFPHFLDKTLVRELGGKELSKVAKQQSSEMIKICKKISTQTNKVLAEAKKLPAQAASRPPKPQGKPPALDVALIPHDNSTISTKAAKSAEEPTYDDGKSTESAYDDGISRQQEDTYDDGVAIKTEPTYDDGTSGRKEKTSNGGTNRQMEDTYDDGISKQIEPTYDDAQSASCNAKSKAGTSEEDVNTGGSGVSKLSSGSSTSGSPVASAVPKSKPYILKEKSIKASDIKDPTFQGMLQKMKPQSEKKKGKPKFQMRYFVLKDQKMYYYDSNVKNQKKQKKCISLEGFIVRQDKELKTRFTLSRPEVRTFLLVASTDAECLLWINYLEKACGVQQSENEDMDGETYESFGEDTVSVAAQEEIYEVVEENVVAEAKKAYTSDAASVRSEPREDEYDDTQPGKQTAVSPFQVKQQSFQEPSNEEIITQYKKLLEQGLVKHEDLYYASWNSTADHRHELSVRQGQMLRLLDRERYGSVGWWVCEANGCRGLVPHLYLQPAFELVH